MPLAYSSANTYILLCTSHLTPFVPVLRSPEHAALHPRLVAEAAHRLQPGALHHPLLHHAVGHPGACASYRSRLGLRSRHDRTRNGCGQLAAPVIACRCWLPKCTCCTHDSILFKSAARWPSTTTLCQRAAVPLLLALGIGIMKSTRAEGQEAPPPQAGGDALEGFGEAQRCLLHDLR